MLIVELLMAGAVAAAPAQAPSQVGKAAVYRNTPAAIDRCRGGGVMQAAKVQSPAELRLGDLPKANFERTVLRTVDGCVKPAIVAYSVGK